MMTMTIDSFPALTPVCWWFISNLLSPEVAWSSPQLGIRLMSTFSAWWAGKLASTLLHDQTTSHFVNLSLTTCMRRFHIERRMIIWKLCWTGMFFQVFDRSCYGHFDSCAGLCLEYVGWNLCLYTNMAYITWNVSERKINNNMQCTVHKLLYQFSELYQIVEINTIRYGIVTCAQKLTKWPA